MLIDDWLQINFMCCTITWISTSTLQAMSSLMGSTIWGSLHYVTNATFWLMQDSGWYNVDFSGVEEWHWGSGTGCSWFETDCMEKGSNAANWPQFFCSSRTDNGCSANYEAPAFCEYYLYRNDLPVGQQYFSDNPNGGGPAAANYCPFRDPSSDHHHVEVMFIFCFLFFYV